MKKVLIVDDEESIRSSLRLLLKAHFDVSVAESGEDAIKIFPEINPDLVLLDLMMPGLDGLDTLKNLKEHSRDLPVIMLTASNTVRTAVKAMKCGAVDYLSKPFDVEELTSLIIQTLDSTQPSPSSETSLKSPTQGDEKLPAGDFGKLVGQSAPMKELFQKIEQVASRETTVLITGESGTGKELVARQIHKLSERSDKPFVAINCAAIPESLIESELFGHERGAFTSAQDKRIGHFELAHGGTLFLDEIGELSLPVQVKMLRFLQEKEFYRVGSSTPIQVDVRIIAATNKNLEDLVREKKFRQDLFYRINVIHLLLPPLRERYEDIQLLLEHLVKRFEPSYGKRSIHFQDSALQLLRDYDWPGNVRELENVLESLLALSEEEEITADMLPTRIRTPEAKQPMEMSIFESNLNFEEAEKRFETEMILKALKRTNHVQTRAAELLGISRRILKYKMDKLGITEELESSQDGQEL